MNNIYHNTLWFKENTDKYQDRSTYRSQADQG